MFWLGIVFEAILWLFCRLNEGFCDEIKCEFLGFWIGKEKHGGVMGLFEEK